MDYLEKSQKVKQEILSAPPLLDITRNAFNEIIKPFSSGGTVNLYHIGMLSSGIYVALRAFRTDMTEGKPNLGLQMILMEHYCQNAEHLYSKGEPVPEFCVGVSNGKLAGILTEDLSRGGTEEVEHYPDDDWALVGAERRKVFVDIDSLFRGIPDIELKYFLADKAIRI